MDDCTPATTVEMPDAAVGPQVRTLPTQHPQGEPDAARA
jgi:hypothetical protein